MSTSTLSTTQYQQLQLKLNAKIKENELLKQQLARLTEDVEELRQDKKYLRGHNEDLKGDMVRLREELVRERREKEEYRALAAKSQAGAPRLSKVEEGSISEVQVEPRDLAALSAQPGASRKSNQTPSRSPSFEVIDVDAIVPEDIDSGLGEAVQDLDMDSIDLTSAMDEDVGQAMGGSAEREIQEPLTPASQTPGFSAKALGKRKQIYDDDPQPSKKAKPESPSALPEPPWVRDSRAKLVFQPPGRDLSELNLGPPVTPPNHTKTFVKLTKADIMALLSPETSPATTPVLACAALQTPQSPPIQSAAAVLQFQPSEPVITLPVVSLPSTPEKPASTPTPAQTRQSPSPAQNTPTPAPIEEPVPQSRRPTTSAPQPEPMVTPADKPKPTVPVYQPEEEEEEEEEGDEPQRPTIKFKEEYALNLPASVIEAHLQGAPKYTPAPAPTPFSVPRIVMRLSYGGSDQHLIQYIAAEKNPSGNKKKRRLVYPMPDMNPAMPMVPGESGLLFASRPELVKDKQGPWSVFRRERKARWVYLGEYENTLVGKMTKEQFCWQKETVQNHWAKLVSTKRSPKYSQMRARIALRKAGKLPVKDKNAASELVSEELEKMKLGKGHPVDQKDILDAFKKGDEGIDILRMKCVSYDHVFIDHVAEEFKKYREGKEAEQKEKQIRMLPANHPLRSVATSRAVSTASPAPPSAPVPSTSVSTSTRVTRSQKAMAAAAAASSASASAPVVASTSKLPPPSSTTTTTIPPSPGPSAPPRVTRSQKAHHSSSSLRASTVVSTSNPTTKVSASASASSLSPSTPVPQGHRPNTRSRPPVSLGSSTTSESAVAMELQVGDEASPEVSVRGGAGSGSGSGGVSEGESGEKGKGKGKEVGSSPSSKNWDWTKVYSWDGQKAIAQRAEEEEEEPAGQPVLERGGYQSDGGLSYVSFPGDVQTVAPAGASTQPAPANPNLSSNSNSKGSTGAGTEEEEEEDGDSGYLSAAGGDAMSDVSDLTDLEDL